jgi:hypothetical protein
MSKPYDAVLKDWYLVEGEGFSAIYGNIYADTKGRFSDGDRVRTSRVTELDREAGIAVTRNTTYKLENERIF